ncbi:MAG: redoxin domain-containing protein [Bacteroidota bacterium]
MDSALFQLSYAALWILVILHSLVLLGVVGIVYQFKQSGSIPSSAELAPGIEAPEFSATDLEGIAISSTQYAGRRTVLLFVSPSCRECTDALGDMTYLKRKAQGNAIVICRAERDECIRLTQQHRLDVPVIADEDNRISLLYRVILVPTAVLISEDARILSYGVPSELEEKEMEMLASTTSLSQHEDGDAAP